MEVASTVVVAPPIERPEQPHYWNCVVSLATTDERDPAAFEREVLRPIEDACGRVRTADPWAARTMDLDVIAWGGRIVSQDVVARPFLIAALRELGVVVPDGAALETPTYRVAPWQWAP